MQEGRHLAARHEPLGQNVVGPQPERDPGGHAAG